jgi:hypothetical protein
MDIAMDRSQEGKPGLEAMRGSSRLFDAGLPSGLDEAALLMHALSFGPLNKNDLARALKQVGLTMPDGSAVTIQKAAECIQHLRKKGHLTRRTMSRWCAGLRFAQLRSRRPAPRVGSSALARPCSRPCPAR